MRNLTVLSFFSQFPGSACGSPPVPSGKYSVVRLDPNLCSKVSTTRSKPTRRFSGSPGSTRSSAAGPNYPPTEACLGGPVTSCRGLSFRRPDPSLPRVQRTVPFRHRTVPAEIGMEWKCVCLRVFRDKAVGQTYTERGLGALAGRVSGPAAALLGRFGDSASRSTGSARRAGGEGPPRRGETRTIRGGPSMVRTMNSALWIGPPV